MDIIARFHAEFPGLPDLPESPAFIRRTAWKRSIICLRETPKKVQLEVRISDNPPGYRSLSPSRATWQMLDSSEGVCERRAPSRWEAAGCSVMVSLLRSDRSGASGAAL
ncbi:hypothetical protein ILYODFUR_034326 [Ilyodon furcidens]|uniref:Uncharacterized protein n=1 Tax=Ilyodon furcidens TaxID=33524 RepID=A0ABV0UPF8_9TELE